MNQGVFPNMTFEEYSALSFLNFSKLKYMEKSPMAFRYFCDNPPVQTEPMRIGNAAHTMILEPAKMGAEIAVWPGPGRRFGKEWDAFCYEHAGKTLLNLKERDFIVGMVNAVHANPDAHRYLYRAKTELSVVWRDLELRRDMKCRIDAANDILGDPVLVSLKTTTDCREFAFGGQYAKMGYAAQDAIYQSGYFYSSGVLPQMITIAVEKLPPHETCVYSIPRNVLLQGEQQVKRWIATLNECERTGKWPAAVEGVVELSMPSWAMSGEFEMDDLEPIER